MPARKSRDSEVGIPFSSRRTRISVRLAAGVRIRDGVVLIRRSFPMNGARSCAPPSSALPAEGATKIPTAAEMLPIASCLIHRDYAERRDGSLRVRRCRPLVACAEHEQRAAERRRPGGHVSHTCRGFGRFRRPRDHHWRDRYERRHGSRPSAARDRIARRLRAKATARTDFDLCRRHPVVASSTPAIGRATAAARTSIKYDSYRIRASEQEWAFASSMFAIHTPKKPAAQAKEPRRGSPNLAFIDFAHHARPNSKNSSSTFLRRRAPRARSPRPRRSQCLAGPVRRCGSRSARARFRPRRGRRRVPPRARIERASFGRGPVPRARRATGARPASGRRQARSRCAGSDPGSLVSTGQGSPETTRGGRGVPQTNEGSPDPGRAAAFSIDHSPRAPRSSTPSQRAAADAYKTASPIWFANTRRRASGFSSTWSRSRPDHERHQRDVRRDRSSEPADGKLPEQMGDRPRPWTRRLRPSRASRRTSSRTFAVHDVESLGLNACHPGRPPILSTSVPAIGATRWRLVATKPSVPFVAQPPTWIERSTRMPLGRRSSDQRFWCSAADKINGGARRHDAVTVDAHLDASLALGNVARVEHDESILNRVVLRARDSRFGQLGIGRGREQPDVAVGQHDPARATPDAGDTQRRELGAELLERFPSGSKE